MAVAIERFSIREYTAKTRNVDFEKCWPFDGGGGALPAMTVRRFRLWSDEVETARSGDHLTAEIAPDEAVIEAGKEMKAHGKLKQRAPKKRSIMELFAVAPQVEAVEDEDGEDEDEANVVGILGKKACIKKNVRKKKKKLRVEIGAGKKAKVPKSKLSPSVNKSHLLKDLVRKKWSKKSYRNLVDSQKKKPTSTKGLKKKNMIKLKQTSKVNPRNRRELAKSIPVHGILKNQTSRTSVKKANTNLDAHGGSLLKLCCESGKHVSFSVKDVMHKSCPQMELSQLQSLCTIFSNALAASSAIDNPNKIDKLSVSIKRNQMRNLSDKGVASSGMGQSDGSLPEPRQASSLGDTEKTFITENLDLNAVSSDSDIVCLNPVTSTSLPSLRYSGDPKVLTIHGQENSIRRMSDSSFLLGPTRKCGSGSDTVSSLTITSTPRSMHSASCVPRSMEANGKQTQSSLGSKMDFLSRVPEFQPMDNLPPKDLMSSICSSVGSKKSFESSMTSEPGSKRTEKFNFEDFIGLPLNSQGELIKSHSGAKFGFNELYKKQNTELDHVHGFNELYKNRVDPVKMKGNWFPEQHYPASKLVSFSDLQGFERMRIQNHESVKGKDHFVHSAENPMKTYCHGCRENIQIHTCNDREKFQAGGILNNEFQPVVQPTMRLMGQNVTVGQTARVSSKSLPDQWPQQEMFAPLASRSPTGSLFQPLEAQSSLYRMPPLLPRSDFGCQPRWMMRNDVSWLIGEQSSNVDVFRHPLPTRVLLNETSNSMFNTVAGTEPVRMRHMASHPQNVYHHMLLSSTHCKHTQSVSYSSSSASNPPFRYQEHSGPSGTSLTSSSPNLPQWLLNSNQQMKTQHSFCPPYSGPVDVHQPCGLLPTPYTASMVPFPIYNSNTSQIYGSTPDSIIHPSFMPAFAENRFSSALNDAYRHKDKSRNGTRSTYCKGLDHAGQSRKRVAGKADGFMKPLKRPFLKMQDDSIAPTSHRRREQLHGYTHNNVVTQEEPPVTRDREVDVAIPVVTNEKDGLISASGSCSLKFDGGSRLGPIKLSAGAKHILKPSLNITQDCPKPIHSTIPFSIGSSSDKLPVPQKKVAKVYRF